MGTFDASPCPQLRYCVATLFPGRKPWGTAGLGGCWTLSGMAVGMPWKGANRAERASAILDTARDRLPAVEEEDFHLALVQSMWRRWLVRPAIPHSPSQCDYPKTS